VLDSHGAPENRALFPFLWLFSFCVEAAPEAKLVQGISWIPLTGLEMFPTKHGKPNSSLGPVEPRSSNDGKVAV